jgi:hypothetical protein
MLDLSSATVDGGAQQVFGYPSIHDLLLWRGFGIRLVRGMPSQRAL